MMSTLESELNEWNQGERERERERQEQKIKEGLLYIRTTGFWHLNHLSINERSNEHKVHYVVGLLLL